MRKLIAGSVSGVRGILNLDIVLQELQWFTSRFTERTESDSFLVGRDTRSTGSAIAKAVAGSLLAREAKVVGLGVVSTPAMFRESGVSGKPAVVVTASHNEPEFNGLRFVIEGLGAGEEIMNALMSRRH